MTLPTSGSISMSQIAAELGLAMPISLTDTAVRTLAGKPTGAVSMPTDFYGKSNGGVTITVGARTNTRVGGAASTTWRLQRTFTPVITGMTPTSYSWSLTTAWGVAGLTSTTGATSAVFITYDLVEEGEGSDSGTVYLTVSDGTKIFSTSAIWSL